MINLNYFHKFSYYSILETRSLIVLRLMESIFGPVPINPVNIEQSLINKTWPCFSKFFNVNSSINSAFVPCILSNVNVQPTSLLKQFCDNPDLTWEQINQIPSRLLASITKGPECAVTRNFTNSVQADIGFRYCLSPYCSSDQVGTSCMGLIIKGPWFTFAHLEIGSGASLALLNKAIKLWCTSTSSRKLRVFERCCHSLEGFMELMQR